MHFIGLIAGMVTFVVYFGMKYTYVARAKAYSSTPSFKEVWEFSFKDHPKRRDVVPIKYIALFFVFTGLFGWSHISHNDVATLWKPVSLLALYLNTWARMAIYEATNWKQGVEKSITAFGMLKKSVQEIGWFPQGKDGLSRTVLVTGIVLILIGLVRIIFALFK